MATVLVALAVMDGSPSHTSVGKEISVPPPATELIPPERKAAAAAISRCEKSTDDTILLMRQKLIAKFMPIAMAFEMVAGPSDE
jgi:hypothetical protein